MSEDSLRAPLDTEQGGGLEVLQGRLQGLEAGERIEALDRIFPGRLVASTSAGIQSAVLLFFLERHAPDTPVVWVDTGYLFGETYRYFEVLKERFSRLNFIEMVPTMSAARQEALFGKGWEDSVALREYNLRNKVEPMNRALKSLDSRCWISGLRAQQSAERGRRALVEGQNQMVKAYPILDWTDQDVDNFIHVRELPVHPLVEFGYLSVGDWHSSRPAIPGESAASTRFYGMKRECGLHELSGQPDFQI